MGLDSIVERNGPPGHEESSEKILQKEKGPNVHSPWGSKQPEVITVL